MPTRDRKRAVIALRDAGPQWNKRAIAKHLRTTEHAIHGFCRRHEIHGVIGQAPPKTGWYALTTEDKASRIAALVAEGKSREQIAAAIGITENALHGFAWRQSARDGMRSITERQSIVIRQRPPEVPDVPVDPAVWQPIHGEPTAFLDNTGCSWPIGENGSRLCCGGPRKTVTKIGADGKPYEKALSYCAEHYAISHRTGRQVDEKTIAWLASLDKAGPAKRARADNGPPVEDGKKTWKSEDGDE